MAFSGYINSVRIHGGVLEPKQVINNFRAGPARSVPEPSVALLATAALLVVGSPGRPAAD